ncbi:MAG: hypothetical protein OEL55_06400 [Desulfobulbaceae bacterium]|nr:hypothetical protein [Desulfobulbaceae bacterium]
MFSFKYKNSSDAINRENVMLLFKHSKKGFKFFYTFLGYPYSSICIMAGDGKVWSFRKSVGAYVCYNFHSRMLSGHDLIDTRIKWTPEIVDMLNSLCGVERGIGVKCVWIIMPVLRLLGECWRIKWNPFELLPGIYAVRAFRCREKFL